MTKKSRHHHAGVHAPDTGYQAEQRSPEQHHANAYREEFVPVLQRHVPTENRQQAFHVNARPVT
jgi:hypothetical protein